MHPTPQPSDPSGDSTLPSTADENSGLHEIKALADSARAKITRRRTSQHDIEESLLSSSSSGLGAVVLPDPGSENALPQAPGRARTGLGRPAPWLWIGAMGVGLAAAAVIALAVLGGSDEGTEVAAVTETASAAELEVGATEAPPPPAPDPVADDDGPDEGARAAEPTVVALPKAEPALADAETDRRPESSSEPGLLGGTLAPSAGTSEAGRERDEARAKGEPDPKKADRSDREREKDAKKAKKKVAAELDREPAGDKSIDEILDGVTGGAPSRPGSREDEEAKKPDKRRLSASDVRRAMGKIGGKARACGKKSGFDGQVTMKFVVEPATGRVSSVKAVGGSPSSAVDRCLRRAIQGARFPTFEPPAMSFRYSFLLEE